MLRFQHHRIAWSLLFFLVTVAAAASDNHLMPRPMSINVQDGRLPLNSSFRVGVVGYDDPQLQSAANRFIDQLSVRTGIPLLKSISRELIFRRMDDILVLLIRR